MNMDIDSKNISKGSPNIKTDEKIIKHIELKVEKIVDTNLEICKPQILTDPNLINSIYTFIQRFPLDYPDYTLWLLKCKRELELNYKHTVYITNSEGIIIGTLIFQKHKQEPQILELKNLRVHPLFENKKIGKKLIRTVEQFAIENGFKRIQGDAHSDNPVIQFMIKMGYQIECEETLYNTKKESILYKDIKT